MSLCLYLSVRYETIIQLQQDSSLAWIKVSPSALEGQQCETAQVSLWSQPPDPELPLTAHCPGYLLKSLFLRLRNSSLKSVRKRLILVTLVSLEISKLWVQISQLLGKGHKNFSCFSVLLEDVWGWKWKSLQEGSKMHKNALQHSWIDAWGQEFQDHVFN